MFKNLKYVFTIAQLKIPYYTDVESRRFGLCLWGWSAGAADVFVAQKNIIRSYAGIKYIDSCTPLFIILGILTLSSLYIF